MQELTPRSASKSIGQYQSHQLTQTGLLVKSTVGHLSIKVFTADVVQIRFSFTELGEDFSYAVVGKPQSASFRVDVDSGQLIMVTEAIKVKISKPSLHIAITDLNDQVINEDDAGLGIQINGEQINCYKKLQEGERFIGLGEKNGPLDKRGRGYVNWNTDAYAYSPDADPLYCSVPFYIGLHHQKVYGIYFDNSHRSTFNFGASTDRFSSFSADAGEMNYYFIGGSSVQSIIQSYTYLTGRTPLPPLWSIGYQQCRYSYYPDREVLRVAENFRERDLPGDAIVLDIHYMDAYKIFTWDKENFPDPKGLIEKLKSLGFNVVVMCDPGIKVEEGYEPYESGKKENVFIKYPDGTNYSGQVWPGWCHFPDFTKEETRSWWANHFKDYVKLGVAGFWNDMNEIATWGNMLPDLMEFDFDGRKSTTREGRNVYGMMMARSTYEGTKKLMNKRPFNLTRSGFAGIQRYAAVWTGDNVAYDAHMMAGIRLVNSMGLSGMAFTGYDIGGFVGNADEKLFARWITIGAFSPFFRGHTMINTRDSEPWSYGEKVEEISRNYMKLRYKLLPYLYSLFYDASKTGMPINRSLAISYPFDEKIYDHQYHNQYLFGPSILVVPAESNKELVKAYLPAGNWYNQLNDQPYTGNQEIIVECPVERLPVYVKGSAIIPMREKAGITTQDTGDTIEIHIYNGESTNEFTLYEDDGISFEYEKNAFAKRNMVYAPSKNELTIIEQEGSYQSAYRFAKIYFHGFNAIGKAWINDAPHQIEKTDYRFISPIKNYDPVASAPEGPKINLPFVKLNYERGKTIIRW